jgi:hypothetical protein
MAGAQTPQHFLNPDPIQANMAPTRSWPDEQRYFFDIDSTHRLRGQTDPWPVELGKIDAADSSLVPMPDGRVR